MDIAKAKENQLIYILYLPKNPNCGKGIAVNNPTILKTIKGTHIQWINLLVGFRWLSEYLSKRMSIFLFTNFIFILPRSAQRYFTECAKNDLQS